LNGASAADRRPTVLLVAHAVHDEGGMERVTAQLIRRAHSRYRMVVVAVDLAPDLQDLVEWRRVRVPRRPAPLRFSSFFVAAGWWIARHRRGVVHTLGAIVPNRVDVATVHYCHATAPHEERRRGMGRVRRVNARIDEWCSTSAERWCYRGRIGVLAAVSTSVAADLAREYPDASIVITPNGVDVGHFRPDAARRAELRARRRVGSDDVVALFVGGDWGRKGLDVVLRALGDVRLRRLPVKLWVVGSGDVAAARGRAGELGVADRVEFFGAVPDPAAWYSAADVFVLASAYEATPLSLLEAAASGLPLISTAVGDAPALIADDGGVIVDRDPAAIADALVGLVEDAAARRRLGAAARARACTRDWDRVSEATIDLYGRLSVGSGDPAP
jgi:glycosyltransferase involved in cell wall biosynthesis